MTSPQVWAHYLKDDVITVRPAEESDADQPARRHEAALPMTSTQALESLKDTGTVPWGAPPRIRLIVGTCGNW